MKSLALVLLVLLAGAGFVRAQSGPAHGTLVVSGGAETGTEIYERFIALAGGPDAPIVVIPTSGNADRYDDSCDCLRWLRKAGARNLRLLHTRERAVANSDTFVRPLREARGVWFAEGNSWRYQDAYLDTRFHRELFALLDRGGVIGGGSAGGRIQSEYIPLRSAEPTQRAIPEKDWRRGFATLSKVMIDAHVLARNRQFDLVGLVNEHPDMLGIGIDENTAIVVHGDDFEVIGGSYVVIYDNQRQIPPDPPGTTGSLGGPFYLLKRGDSYNLRTRVALRGRADSSHTRRPVERVVARPWKS